jgi:phosphotransferase system  glucose/maltose/N-acetylglucosamine-specific IIC component
MPYAWREVPPHPSPFPRRRAAPSVRKVTGTAAVVALVSGLLAFFVWPAVLGVVAVLSGGTGWFVAKHDDGPGDLLAAAGVVIGALALIRVL